MLSVIVIYIINKPKKPIFTGTLIFFLICSVAATWLTDTLISTYSSTQSFMEIVSFITMLNNPTYTQLEEVFDMLVVIDTLLFAVCVISMIIEAVNILKGDKSAVRGNRA